MLSRTNLNSFLFFCFFTLNAYGVEFTKDNLSPAEKINIIEFCMTRTPIEGSLKPELMQKIKAIFKTNAFVETGTFEGRTTAQAAKVFDEVYTIELSKELAEKAKENFKDTKNVKVYQGDSGNVIASILPNIKQKIFFYLDGHYSEYNTAKGPLNTPLMNELAAIRDSKKSDSVIIVDDIRCFQKSAFPDKIINTCWEGYPELDQVVKALLEINPNYQICFLSDALLAYPKDPSVKLSAVAQACAVHRLASVFPVFTMAELKDADYAISHAQGNEREEIFNYWRTFSPSELEKGVPSYGTLWTGMILEQEGKKEEALNLYKQAVGNSLPNWRITTILSYTLLPVLKNP